MRAEALLHADVVLTNAVIRVDPGLCLRPDICYDGRLPADRKSLSIMPRPLDVGVRHPLALGSNATGCDQHVDLVLALPVAERNETHAILRGHVGTPRTLGGTDALEVILREALVIGLDDT